MSTLSEMLTEAMREKKYSIRTLEAATIEKYGEGMKISRSLVSDYLIGIRAPTYINAVIISELLDLDKKDVLMQTFLARLNDRKNAEQERFQKFCIKEGVGVTREDLINI